ncbi:transglutaminase-like putative cysteine protease [Methanolinea mesophila]|uniref:transglutaminase-like domain-containing protein n=1 Tax=Methanolinea mesophila TaxID=547055 RepID=UPI001AE6A92B|nr:transglutaminase domain-containing protein [Methanolinea mesophila]MBP1928980.1 transglutaminase-like putative cysteine protease [Methanolinea mesophila]
MKTGRYTLLLVILLLGFAILACGCLNAEDNVPPSGDPDKTLALADTAYEQGRYRTASALYDQAYGEYTSAGNTSAALEARNGKFRAKRMILEFPYNLSGVMTAINETFPDVAPVRKAGWIVPGESQQIVSDSEVLYYEGTVKNIYFHNPDLIRARMAALGHTAIYDQAAAVALGPVPPGDGPYVNPVTFEGTGTLTVPGDTLPPNGTLRIWLPLPIETDSQREVAVLSVEPARYIVSGPDTTGDIGLVYLEIPLEEVSAGDLTVSTRFRFTEYEQRFTIDRAKAGVYNTSDPLYIAYTSPGDNIVITPEMAAKAREMVGSETNPYTQARRIYWYIIGNNAYSLAPHLMLDTAGIPESSYMLETGFGDCGTQSMYYAALCRSLGIPARAIGGYQLLPGVEGTHFWAEFYLPEYGWVPVDVTIAEAADWSFNATPGERESFRDYYIGNLDPYRFVIQKDVDIPLDPDPGDAVLFSTVHQKPAVLCDTCTEDMELVAVEHWKMEFQRV